MNTRNPVVLVAPLDWGLGHATRCIPVIRELIQQGANVLCSAHGGGLALLQKEFPEIRFIDIPGFQIRYPEKGSMAISILLQMPGFLSSIKREHKLLEEIINSHNITHVISDNRYGLFSRRVKCVFITHQVKIKSSASLKFLESFLFQLNKKQIEKFDLLWIPDEPAPHNLAGELSDCTGINIPATYIGILSRFHKKNTHPEKIYDVIALLSGPEPQRTILENKIIKYFLSSGKKCLLIGGLPHVNIESREGDVHRLSTVNDEYLQNILHPETLLICRPGYSTIMDLAVLHHEKIIFVPTPGQTEQEYLGKILSEKNNFYLLAQDEDFPRSEIKKGISLKIDSDDSKLKSAIESFLFN